MAKTYQEIIEAIDNHLKKSGRQYYSQFYIGITNDISRRLFSEHRVKEHSWWIYRTADSSETARKVEEHYLDLGMRGGNGGGNDESRIVYCYAVTPLTIE